MVGRSSFEGSNCVFDSWFSNFSFFGGDGLDGACAIVQINADNVGTEW